MTCEADRIVGASVGPAAAHQPTPMSGVLAWLEQREAFSVVQIGAYVGDTQHDPLYDFLCRVLPRRRAARAVLVEPVAEYFEQLRDAYRGVPGLSFENVAIADADGERDFYRLGVDPAAHGRPDWLEQLGSLRPDRMTDMWDRYEQRIHDREGRVDDLRGFWLAHRWIERVPCLTLHTLLDRHRLARLDLLQIDAEGYDYEILRSVDFERVRPRFINYERVLLHDDEPACRAMLVAAGYVLLDWGQDTLCVALE